MELEELFDAYRQVVSERDMLRQAGDAMWYALPVGDDAADRWHALRRIGTEPPLEDWLEC